jgi:ABC-type branched-subunit amino acid transport system ATPase component
VRGVARTFQQWKIWAAARLVEIIRTTQNDKIRRDAELLLTRLQYLRLESLPSFLVTLHAAAQDDPAFFELAPSAEEVERWFQEGGELG